MLCIPLNHDPIVGQFRVTDAIELQPLNADSMVLTELPMVTDAMDVQSLNALFLMISTESGMVTDLREVHPSNAWTSMALI